MTRSRFIVLLILANAIILAGAYYYWDSTHLPGGAIPTTVFVTNEVPTIVTVTNSPPEPLVVVQTNRFHWRQVESSDYRTYIANLRSVGCPETTIKDIILTDIMKLFAERRGRFYQNGREFKFWETSEKRSLNARQLEEREKELTKIDKEMPGVLRGLLGINYDREINKYFVDNRDDERRLSFIPENKREQLLALRDEIEGLKEHLVDQAQNGQPVDLEGLKKIQEHRQQILSQILTPEERQEYELRTSETAERLRNQLVGFNPSEQEFRDIYNLWQAHDDKYAYVSADDTTARKAKEQDEKRIEDEVRAKLSPERYAEYARTQNQDYQQLCFFAERYELPQSTIQSVLEIKQIAENARKSLLADSVAEAERQAGLKAIQDETQRALRQNLGDKLFSAYVGTAGNWMDSLSVKDSTPK